VVAYEALSGWFLFNSGVFGCYLCQWVLGGGKLCCKHLVGILKTFSPYVQERFGK
jgi:hypothetical protein